MTPPEDTLIVLALDVGITTGVVSCEFRDMNPIPLIRYSGSLSLEDLLSKTIDHIAAESDIAYVEKPLLNPRMDNYTQVARTTAEWLQWLSHKVKMFYFIEPSQWKSSRAVKLAKNAPKTLKTRHERDAFAMAIYARMRMVKDYP